MGEHQVHFKSDRETRQQYIRLLLDDIEALDQMLRSGQIEKGITRIGAEQEFCLINRNGRPEKNASLLLNSIQDEHFTTELAKYNLEINLDPFEFKKDAFQKMEDQLNTLLDRAKQEAAKEDTRIVITGILPSIGVEEVGLDYMTDNPRYAALNNMLKTLRGSDFRMHLSGVDELSIKHDSVMYEACNTSFQMHLQIDPDDFESSYNWAQMISAPVLGVAVNSPLLLGKELWQETRIALFQQSIDTRNVSYAQRDQQARVVFGDHWTKGSIVDFYKNEVSRYKIILSKDLKESALSQLGRGEIPKLKALGLHNGTLYKWNRPCFGVGRGKAHIRIENRYIPAGPSVLDEMANFAFWAGLMYGRPEKYNKLDEQMDFKEVKSNFTKAARYGSETLFQWMGKTLSLKELLEDELLPIARKGLEKAQIQKADIDRYLSVIQGRLNRHTPAQWMIQSFRNLSQKMKRDEAMLHLTLGIHKLQEGKQANHEWEPLEASSSMTSSAEQVGHIMSTNLFTAYEDDTAELILKIMAWKNIHHLPIVDRQENLVGLLTWTHIKRYQEKKKAGISIDFIKEIMETKVETTASKCSISEAIQIMKAKEIGCLPVLHKEQLIGIITIHDLRPFLNA